MEGWVSKEKGCYFFLPHFALRKVFSRYYSFKAENLITYGGSPCMFLGYHTWFSDSISQTDLFLPPQYQSKAIVLYMSLTPRTPSDP
jgi:hypothetical protein